jgi:hypothetical protein
MLKLKELLAAVGIVAAVLFLTAAVGPGGDTGTPGTPGTVINTGASTVGAVPRYTDTTGTNVAPSTVSIGSNGGVTITNAAASEAGLVINQFTGATNAAISVNTAGASQFKLYGEAANTLAMRNGTAAQTFLAYGTYTDALNYKRAAFSVSNAGILTLAAAGLGTGATGNSIAFGTDGAVRWNISSSGHFLAATDNTYDIGASGATRPANIYSGTSVNIGPSSASGSSLTAAAWTTASSGVIAFNSRSRFASPANSVMTLYNATNSDFDRLQFGGTSASFPALKRSTTNLVVRLADDSANTGLEANVLISRLNATSAAAPTIASATTIAPTNSIVFISGTTAIETITAPAPISATGGQITLIPTGIFTTTTAGNIALASTAVVSKAMIMTYDSGTTKWYPSY